MKKPKPRTVAQIRAEKKRALRKRYIRSNKGSRRLSKMLAKQRFEAEVRKQVKKMVDKKVIEDANNNSSEK